MAYTAFSKYRQQTATRDMNLNPYKTVPPIQQTSSNETETQKDNDEEKYKDKENNEDKEVDEGDKDNVAKEDIEEAEQNKGDRGDDDDDDDAGLNCDELYDKSMARMSQESFSLDDAVKEIKKHLAILSTLMQKKDYTSRASYIHNFFIYKVYYKFTSRGEKDQLGAHIARLTFVESYQKLLRHSVTEDVYEDNSPENNMLRHTLKSTTSFVWNMSDKSRDFCDKIISVGLHKDFFEYLGGKYLAPEKLSNSQKRTLVQGLIGALHNVVQKSKNARESFRACKAVDVLQPLREAVEYQMISCVALMIQSYLVTEDENEKINSGTEVFELLVTLLQCSVEGSSYQGLSFAPVEVLEALNNLAVNDSNKERIIDCGALPFYVQILQNETTLAEKAEAARGIWTLAFNKKCKEHILKESGCIEVLRSLVEQTDNEDLKKNAEGALWILQDEEKAKNSKANDDDGGKKRNSDDEGHVFISYQWDAKPTVLKLRDRLKAAGFKVWIDEDDMSGSVLEAMAMAVEKATVVLICLSQKYKESPSCRTEAEYTFRVRKPYIPLRLQQGYYPDGWLGAMAGSRLVFDFSVPSKYEDSVKHLTKELGNYTNTASDVVDGIVPSKAPVTNTMQPSHEKSSPINSWKSENVNEWLEKHNLKTLIPILVGFDGPTLLELHYIRQEAPDSFFTYFNKEGVGILDQTRLSRALRDLT